MILQLTDQMAIDPEYIADALGIELRQYYCEFVNKLDNYPEVAAVLNDSISTDSNLIINLNQRLATAAPIAGISQWPDDYFVIGEDGCGNYYVLNEDNDTVLFYDHESDAIVQVANSLDDFANRRRIGEPLDEVVVHSGYKARQKKARQNPRKASQVSFSADDPGWSQDWLEFVAAFMEIASREATEDELVSALNHEFGRRPVCWVGKVTDIQLGRRSRVTIEMPACEHITGSSYGELGTLSVALRTDVEDYDHVQILTPEIRTTVDAWRSASIGDTIRFQMMIAPGHANRIACIQIRPSTRSSGQWVTIRSCGAHLVEVIRDT